MQKEVLEWAENIDDNHVEIVLQTSKGEITIAMPKTTAEKAALMYASFALTNTKVCVMGLLSSVEVNGVSVSSGEVKLILLGVEVDSRPIQ